MKKKVLIHIIVVVSILVIPCIVSCSTGIEGTKRIKMSRNDLKAVRPSQEDLLEDSIYSLPVEKWGRGKRFLINDEKFALVYEKADEFLRGIDSTLTGKVIAFRNLTKRTTPGGDEIAVLEFDSADGIYRYATTRTQVSVKENFTGLDLPMLIDLDMVAMADSVLAGRTLWTLSRLWYDKDGNSIPGRKYVPISVKHVYPGNNLFPLEISFVDDKGKDYNLYMNIRTGSGIGAESRTLGSLFSLTDPKAKYQSIIPEYWEAICDGKVLVGMTKDECRLALGNPAEVDTGHNWNTLIDIWGYSDGTYLRFQDGLLVDYRN